jgi:hypothetical protein
VDSFITLILRVLQVAQAMLGFPVFTILATFLLVGQLRASNDCFVRLIQLPLECQCCELAANLIHLISSCPGDSNQVSSGSVISRS